MTGVLSLALTPWGPVLLLLLGAAALFPVNVRRLPRAVQSVTIIILGFTWVWVMLLNLSPAPVVSAEVTRAPLDIAVYALFRVDGVTWPFAALVITVGWVGAFLWPAHPPVGRVSGPSVGLVLIAGAMLMAIAGNLPALFLGWVVMEAAYLALLLDVHPRATGRAVGLSLLGPLILWIVLAALPTDVTVQPWQNLVLPTWALALLAVTVWLRVGVYPLHRQHVMRAPGFPPPWLWLDAVVGARWLTEWATLEGASLFWQHQTWVVLGVFAFFGSALAAWLSRSARERLRWVLVQRSGVLILLPLMASPPWDSQALALAAVVPLVGGALLMLEGVTLPRGHRAVWLVAAFLLWGVPGSAAAVARAVLAHGWTWHPLAGLLLLLGDGLVLAVLLLPEEEAQPGGWQAVVRVGILLLPVLVMPLLLSERLALPVGTWAWTTLVPLALGLFFAWQHGRIFVDVRGWAWSLELLAYLEPMESAVRNAVGWVLSALGGIVALVEGSGWAGWILLGVVLYLLSTRT